MTQLPSNKPINIGIIGTGYIANYHLEVLSKLTNVHALACYDVNLQRAETLKDNWRIAHAYDNIDRFLDSNRFDVIHVLVPPIYHYAVTKKVLEHKINVLIEKPMCVTSQECQDLIEIGRGNGVKIGVNHNAVYQPLFLKLQTDIRDGLIGKIDHVVAFQGGPLGQLDAGKFGHWMFREPKNVLLEQAPHPISQVRALLGEVKDIQATVSVERELGYNQFFYDRWQAVAKCEKGSAFLHLSFGKQYYAQNWISVSGEDGSIRVDLLKNLYLIQKKSIFPDYLDSWANGMAYSQGVMRGFNNFCNYAFSKLKLREKSDVFYVSMKNSIKAFYTSFLNNEDPPISGEDGKRIVEFCEKWIEAAKPRENPKPIQSFKMSKNMQPKVLVTGATGFIGKILIEKLITQGNSVRVLVRNLEGLPKTLYSPLVEVLNGDITNPKEVDESVRGIKCVYHLAHGGGQTWNDFKRNNIEATLNVAEAVLKEKVKYLIYASTIASYYYADIPNDKKVDETIPIDSHPEKRNFYARSKILAEKMLMEMVAKDKLPLVMFRPGVVVGREGRIYHDGVGLWTRDNVCAYWGMGKNGLPFVLVEDIVEALLTVLVIDNLQGEIFNLVGDVRLSAREYLDYLRSASGRHIKSFPYPTPLMFIEDSFKYLIKLVIGEHKNALLSYRDLSNRSIMADFDCSKAKKVLGWKPCSLREEFVKDAIDWAFAKEEPCTVDNTDDTDAMITTTRGKL